MHIISLVLNFGYHVFGYCAPFLVVEKILEKRKKLYAAFMDLEKAYDRVDWLALWEVLRI